MSRRRSPDDIENIIRENAKQGVEIFFITDDNFARNRDWEDILDRIIQLKRKEKLKIRFIFQVDALAHKIPNFVEKCRKAGAKRVFIGHENINPDNLREAKKRQNRITEYREMLLTWKKAGVTTYVGYILGFPHDTFDSIARDIDILKHELPVDILEFFYLTPLPGSEDHQKLVRAGGRTDPDLNKYDLNHICAGHPKMSADEWKCAYAMAWERYYTPDHIETMLKRTLACGGNAGTIAFFSFWFTSALAVEGLHPLEIGFLRRKYRRDRRPSLPRESALTFYPKYAAETVVKFARLAARYYAIHRKFWRLRRDPDVKSYVDAAIAPVAEGGALLESDAAKAYVAQQERLARLRQGDVAA